MMVVKRKPQRRRMSLKGLASVDVTIGRKGWHFAKKLKSAKPERYSQVKKRFCLRHIHQF